MDSFSIVMRLALYIRNIFLLSLFFISSPAFSADIYFDRKNAQIILTGEIKKGDFEKFLNATLEGGTRVSEVYLASNGGDVVEAVKIGRFIRAIGYSTKVPFTARGGKVEGKPMCQNNIPVTEQECTCMSSCSLIYLAGVERKGDFLGVHRAYLNHEQLKDLSLDDAKKVGAVLSASVNKYMLEMQAPISLIDRINSKSSKEIDILPIEYVDKHLNGFTPDYQEWLIAKCGDREEYMREEYSDEMSDYSEWEKKYGKITDERFQCYYEQRVNEIERKFYKVVKKALEPIDSKLIPHRSLLEYISKVDRFDVLDLIGKMNNEAIDLMSLMAIGLVPSDSLVKPYNAHIIFDKSVVVGFNEDGTVYNVELYFNGYHSDYRGYEGHFLDGFSSSSKPKDFIKKYGSPYESACYPSNNCFVTFELKKADLQVLFDEERRLISISVMRPQYWRSLSKNNPWSDEQIKKLKEILDKKVDG